MSSHFTIKEQLDPRDASSDVPPTRTVDHVVGGSWEANVLPVPVEGDGPGRVIILPRGTEDFRPRDGIEPKVPERPWGGVQGGMGVAGKEGFPEARTDVL